MEPECSIRRGELEYRPSLQMEADFQIDFTSTEWMIPPIIQSGGKYDLRLSAQSNQDPLKPGVILCTLGMRYKNYCSSMGRTFMIDPHAVGPCCARIDGNTELTVSNKKSTTTSLSRRELRL